jgi:membrane-associated protease RseP (regulator of RpoE activity)
MANDQLTGFPQRLGAPPRFEQPEPPRVSSAPPQPQKSRIWLHFLLFGLTAVSMQATAMELNAAPPGHTLLGFAAYQSVSLLAILLVHELGHYIAARLHRVPASMPYLLDIGAAGPIAGMVVAIPVLCWGLALSDVGPHSTSGYAQEGQSILYWLLKRVVLGPIPPGHDVNLHPMAFAGWGGMFLTMLNLLPWGQLDGGHIAYALFGDRQYVFARWVRRGLLGVFFYNVLALVVPVLLHRSSQPLFAAVAASMVWLVWYGITGLMSRFFGEDHPPFEPGELGAGRKGLAVACLVLFVLLFMPTPFAVY